MTVHAPGPVLSEHIGVVRAPAGRVRHVVLAVGTGELNGSAVPLVLGGQAGQRVVVTGGPEVFRATMSGVPLTIEVDHDGGWVQARGQWWWCGRLQVEEGGPGETLVRRITFNVAPGVAAKLVPFTVGRGHRRGGERALRHLLDDLSQRLGCETWILPDG